MSVRMGLIGCGEWGRNHARCMDRFGVLCAVADTLPDRAKAFSARAGVPAMTPDELIADPSIDAVVITVLPSAHSALAMRVLQAGKHVLVEKPMALDATAAQQVCDAARTADRVAMTGHILRFHPAFTKMLDLIADGTLGRVERIEARRKSWGKFFPNVSALRDLGPHDFSLLLAISGRQPVASRGRYTCVETTLPDAAEVELDFGEGLTAGLQLSRVHDGKERWLSVRGDRATAIFDDLSAYPEKLMLSRNGAPAQPVQVAETAPLDAQLKHFIDCMLDRSVAPLASVEHGKAVMQAIDALDLDYAEPDQMPEHLFGRTVAPAPQVQAGR